MKKITSLLLSVLMLLSITAGMDLSAYAATSGKCGANVTWSLNTSTGVLTLSGSGATYDYEYDTNPFSSNKLSIKSIIVQKGITDIGAYIFAKSNVQSVVIADGVESLGASAFCDCESLYSINLPDTIRYFDSTSFAGCAYTEDEDNWSGDILYIGNYIYSVEQIFDRTSTKLAIKDGTVGIADWAFTDSYYHVNTTEIYFPDSLRFIGESNFYGFDKLKKINFPKNLEYIGKEAFWASGFSVLDLSKTKLTEISSKCFYAMENLEKIYFPATLKKINDNAIGGSYTSYKITDIYYPNTKDQWSNVVISNDYDYPSYGLPRLLKNGQITVHCSDGDIVTKNGWQKESGVWRYYDNGSAVTGWQRISNAWYYFDSNGVMQTGWQKIGGSWYYFASGGAMQTGWQKIGSTWYYFKSGGQMVTGWQKIGSTWYYFKSGGAMVTGWQKIGSTWYYFKSGGAMVTGWQKISNKWYYFESSGAMRTANLRYKGKTYRFNSSGACLNP